MARASVDVARSGATPDPDPAVEMRYVARQPILDLQGKVHGYELLFRNGPQSAFSGDGDSATRTMIDNAVLYGLGQLTSNLHAFLNCTEEALTGQMLHILPAGMMVLEILETIEPTPALIDACRRLKAAGYRLALDDFTWKPGFEPLIEIVDYIKVDFVLSNARERRKLLQKLHGVTAALIAEKIETQEDYRQARDEGFTLVQGYYFCRPVLMGNHKVPANRLLQIEILRMLQGENMDINELAGLVKRDASLTYRLLRLVNSPMCAMRQEVRSVKTALIALGEEAFRRMATLAIASELNVGQTTELLRMAFVRGRFCELASVFCGLNHAEQYLLGMLSLLPAMLRTPMSELSPYLPFGDAIRRALEGEPLPERALLDWLECHERGDWSICDAIAERYGLHRSDLMVSYQEALQWAEEALGTTV